MRLLLLLAITGLSLTAKTFYVTVAGLGGEPDYEQRFTSLAKDLDKIFQAEGNDVSVHTLSGDEARKDRLRSVLEEIARSSRPEDALAVMLIGHGTYDGYEYKVNLVGPDLSDIELAELLNAIPATRQLVANMTSSSGGSLMTLRRDDRTVITATKSGTERNAVVFSRYWVAALQDAAADTDKNDVISALEAYEYAARKTKEFYTSQRRLATEHPLLEDTGRGEGVRSPSAQNGEGLKARHFALLRIGDAQLASQDPAKRELLVNKERVERAIDKLKYEKAAMPFEEYRSQLTALLLELARTQQALDAK